MELVRKLRIQYYKLKHKWTTRGPNTMRRRKMSKKSSRKNFRKGAMRIHPKNMQTTPLRGGTRL